MQIPCWQRKERRLEVKGLGEEVKMNAMFIPSFEMCLMNILIRYALIRKATTESREYGK